jgi:hypothetical protein
MTQQTVFASDGNGSPSGLRSGCNAESERLDSTQSEYRDNRPRCGGLFTNRARGVTGDKTLEFGTTWKIGTRRRDFLNCRRCDADRLNFPSRAVGSIFSGVQTGKDSTEQNYQGRGGEDREREIESNSVQDVSSCTH